jgi:hypothetical protein
MAGHFSAVLVKVAALDGSCIAAYTTDLQELHCRTCLEWRVSLTVGCHYLGVYCTSHWALESLLRPWPVAPALRPLCGGVVAMAH